MRCLIPCDTSTRRQVPFGHQLLAQTCCMVRKLYWMFSNRLGLGCQRGFHQTILTICLPTNISAITSQTDTPGIRLLVSPAVLGTAVERRELLPQAPH